MIAVIDASVLVAALAIPARMKNHCRQLTARPFSLLEAASFMCGVQLVLPAFLYKILFETVTCLQNMSIDGVAHVATMWP